jgi:hypothetical protein
VSSSKNLSDQDSYELPDEFQNLANNTVSHFASKDGNERANTTIIPTQSAATHISHLDELSW